MTTMKQMVRAGLAIDISNAPTNPDGDFILDHFTPGVEYCVLRKEQWVKVVARDGATGLLLASCFDSFYDPWYHVLHRRES